MKIVLPIISLKHRCKCRQYFLSLIMENHWLQLEIKLVYPQQIRLKTMTRIFSCIQQHCFESSADDVMQA